MRQGLVLAGQGSSGDLGDHEARVDPAVFHQERRQLGHVLVHHQRDTALAERTDFSDGQGDVVGGHGHRLGVEVTAGNHVTFGSEHQRVVRHGVGFDAQYLGGLAQLGQAGAHDLRLAAQRVRVLNLVAVLVRQRHFAGVAQQVTEAGSGVDLAALATHFVDARIERRARAQCGFDAQAAAGDGSGVQVFTLEQATQGIGGGRLGAVEQGQALLGGQGQRLEAGHGQGFGGWQPLALVAGLAFTQQHQRHVRQRGEVAGGAHRTLQRDVRVDFGVDQGDQRVDDLATDAGEATAEAVDLQHHDQAHQVVIQRRADTGGVGQHQRALQVFQVVAGDAGRGQQAETGVDAVGGTVFGNDLLDAGNAGVDGRRGAGVQLQAHGRGMDGAQLGQGQGAGLEGQFGHFTTPIAWSRRPVCECLRAPSCCSVLPLVGCDPKRGDQPVIIGRSRPCSLAHSMAMS